MNSIVPCVVIHTTSLLMYISQQCLLMCYHVQWLLTFKLFNYCFSTTEVIYSLIQNGEWVRISKESVVSCLNVLSQHSSWETGRQPLQTLGFTVTQTRYEPGTFQIQVWGFTATPALCVSSHCSPKRTLICPVIDISYFLFREEVVLHSLGIGSLWSTDVTYRHRKMTRIYPCSQQD